MPNSKAKVSIKTLDDGYILVVDGEESEETEYGDPVEMTTTDGRRFIALVEAQGKKIESLTEFWAYEALPVEEVALVEPDEDEDEDDDGQGDDDQDEDDEDDDDDDQGSGDLSPATV